MEKNNLFKILVVLDVLLLVLALVIIADWYGVVGTLKSPCGKCAHDNENASMCFENLMKTKYAVPAYAPKVDGLQINLSGYPVPDQR